MTQTHRADHRFLFVQLIGRPLGAVLNPWRFFAQMQDYDGVPWLPLAAFLGMVGFLDVLVGPSLFLKGFVWVPKQLPHDWIPYALGWACFDVSQWLCWTILFVVINRLQGYPLRSLKTLWTASYYLIFGMGVLVYAINPVHTLCNIPPVRIDFDWVDRFVPGYERTDTHYLFGHARLAHLVTLPWLLVGSLSILRHLLRVVGSYRTMVATAGIACSLAIGRLVIEPFPFYIVHIVYYALHLRVPYGLIIFVTNLLLMLSFAACLRCLATIPAAPGTSKAEPSRRS